MTDVNFPFVIAIRKPAGRKPARVLYYYRRRGYQDPATGRATTALPPDPTSEIFARVWRECHDLAEIQINGAMAEAPPAPGTFADLAARFRAARAFTGLAEKTRRDYGKHLDALEDRFGALPVAGLNPDPAAGTWPGRVAVLDYRETLAGATGPRQADYRIAVLRRVLNFAVDRGELMQNPAARPGRLYRGGRAAVWSWDQERAWLAAARRAIPSLKLRRELVRGFRLLAYTAQRPGDVRHMPRTKYQVRTIVLPDGTPWTGPAIEVRQRKTGALVWIRAHRDLVGDLDRTAAETGRLYMIQTAGGAPFKERYFAALFDKVSAAAGISGVRRQDLRRTAVVRLRDAGCTVAQIAGITGHSIEETAEILETYMPATAGAAAAAVVKLEDFTRERRSQARDSRRAGRLARKRLHANDPDECKRLDPPQKRSPPKSLT